MIKSVHTPEDIARTCELARHIWTEHFTPIIGPQQVRYMLEKFQSFDAIRSQIEDGGYRYFLLLEHAKPQAQGYLAVKAEPNALFLSKIYLRKECRGRGDGKRMMAFVKELARKAGLEGIRLTVNRNNREAIDFYRACGFELADTQVTDIGDGFVMDDYVMRLEIPG